MSVILTWACHPPLQFWRHSDTWMSLHVSMEKMIHISVEITWCSMSDFTSSVQFKVHMKWYIWMLKLKQQQSSVPLKLIQFNFGHFWELINYMDAFSYPVDAHLEEACRLGFTKVIQADHGEVHMTYNETLRNKCRWMVHTEAPGKVNLCLAKLWWGSQMQISAISPFNCSGNQMNMLIMEVWW